MNTPTLSPTPGAVTPGPFNITPAQVALTLDRHGRDRFEAFVQVAIDLLDLTDGDSDLEPDDVDSGIEDDPLGCDPEEDRGADDGLEEDWAEHAPILAYDVDQTEPLPRLHPDTVADIPCTDIAFARKPRPVLRLRLGGTR